MLLLLLVLLLQVAVPTIGDAAELEASELLNPFNAVGLLLGTAVAGAVAMQKKQSEVSHSFDKQTHSACELGFDDGAQDENSHQQPSTLNWQCWHYRSVVWR